MAVALGDGTKNAICKMARILETESRILELDRRMANPRVTRANRIRYGGELSSLLDLAANEAAEGARDDKKRREDPGVASSLQGALTALDDPAVLRAIRLFVHRSPGGGRSSVVS
jgi:hypothetical protein